MKKIFIIGVIFVLTSCSKETISKDDNLGVYNAMALISGVQYHNSTLSIYKSGDKYIMGFNVPNFNPQSAEMLDYDGKTFSLGLLGAKSIKGRILNSSTVDITFEYSATQTTQAYSDYIIGSK